MDTFFEHISFKYGKFYTIFKLIVKCEDKNVQSVTLHYSTKLTVKFILSFTMYLIF